MLNLWDNKAAPNRNIAQWHQAVDYLFYSLNLDAKNSGRDVNGYIQSQKIDLHHQSLVGTMTVEISIKTL